MLGGLSCSSEKGEKDPILPITVLSFFCAYTMLVKAIGAKVVYFDSYLGGMYGHFQCHCPVRTIPRTLDPVPKYPKSCLIWFCDIGAKGRRKERTIRDDLIFGSVPY